MSADMSRQTATSTVREWSNTTAASNLDPVSNELREIFQVVVFCLMSGITSLFGTGANIVNITIFIRQGFKDSINVSLLGLAVADLGCVLTMFWMSLGFCPLFQHADLLFNPLDVIYVTGGWPHVYFNRTTSLITAFISIERCLCVTIPLKVKSVITRTRTKIIITIIFSFTAIVFSPMFYVNQLRWSFSHTKNRTQLFLVFTENRVVVETITLPIYSVAMSCVSLVTVAVCTGVLIAKLKEKTKWRNDSVVQAVSKMENITNRDRKLLKMITLISSIFVVCYTPATANFLLMAYAPEFSLVGKYANVFFVVWCLTLLVEAINSSVNIFIYFNMSSKFRKDFLYLFCGHLKQDV